VRVGTYDFGDIVTHEHRISADGNTVWVARTGTGIPEPGKPAPGPTLHAIDTRSTLPISRSRN